MTKTEGLSGLNLRETIGSWAVFFLMGHSRPLFLYFCLFYFNVQLVDAVCKCWDSNCGFLVWEVTALPTEPPPLPLGGRLRYRTGNQHFATTFGFASN